MARVLIIDDDAPTRDVLRQLLNREGYETVEACDGREGVQCSQAASMDVIILDMLLPEQNGLEVIRELRGEGPGGADHRHLRVRAYWTIGCSSCC